MANPKDGRPPAFQLYASDLLSDLRFLRMSDAAQGVYFRVLAVMWSSSHDFSSLPDDDGELARIFGKTRRTWRKLRAEMMPETDPLLEVAGDRIVSSMLKTQAEAQAEYRRQRAAAGKKGAERRWQSHGSANGEGMAEPCEIDASPNGEPVAEAMASDGSSSSSSSSTEDTPQTSSSSRKDVSEEALEIFEIEELRAICIRAGIPAPKALDGWLRTARVPAERYLAHLVELHRTPPRKFDVNNMAAFAAKRRCEPAEVAIGFVSAALKSHRNNGAPVKPIGELLATRSEGRR